MLKQPSRRLSYSTVTPHRMAIASTNIYAWIKIYQCVWNFIIIQVMYNYLPDNYTYYNSKIREHACI